MNKDSITQQLVFSRLEFLILELNRREIPKEELIITLQDIKNMAHDVLISLLFSSVYSPREEPKS